MQINLNIDTIYNVKMSTHFKMMHMNYYIPKIHFKSLQISPWRPISYINWKIINDYDHIMKLHKIKNNGNIENKM